MRMHLWETREKPKELEKRHAVCRTLQRARILEPESPERTRSGVNRKQQKLVF